MSPNCPNQAMISETSFRCFVPGRCSRVWWADWRRKQLSPVSRAREATATGHYGVTGDSSCQDSSFPDYAQTGWAGRPGHAQLCRRHASSGQERVGCLKRRTFLDVSSKITSTVACDWIILCQSEDIFRLLRRICPSSSLERLFNFDDSSDWSYQKWIIVPDLNHLNDS